MGHPARGASHLSDALWLLSRPPQVGRQPRRRWLRRAPCSEPAKRRDKGRYGDSSGWQTVPANHRSAEQIASVFSFGVLFVFLTLFLRLTFHLALIASFSFTAMTTTANGVPASSVTWGRGAPKGLLPSMEFS